MSNIVSGELDYYLNALISYVKKAEQLKNKEDFEMCFRQQQYKKCIAKIHSIKYHIKKMFNYT